MKKLWLDDLRRAPKDWTWVQNADDCVKALETEEYDTVSLDHDLGDPHLCGCLVLAYLEVRLNNGKSIPQTILVHSMNPAARERMEQAIRRMREREHSQAN
jgi:hypothetical protein